MAFRTLSADEYRETLEAVALHGNASAAARALGIKDRTFRERAQTARLMFPDVLTTDMKTTGTSTLLDKDGKTVLQWVKTSADQLKQQATREEVFKALFDKLPRYEPVKAPIHTSADLLSLYVLADAHIGMLADAEECGVDWDTKKAEALVMAWFEKAVSLSPNSGTAVLAILGDLTHGDSWVPETPTGKNSLDIDTRFQKIIRVIIRLIRRVNELLLKKHGRVHVIIVEGNHDIASSAWMREWLSAVYENDPRISVDASMDAYNCFEFGQCSLFFAHGHKKKFNVIDDTFVAKYREVFGRTKFSYAHLGHYHHSRLNETNLMIVEQHRTLAPKDAYASKGGWMSGRDAKIITYHRDFGEVSRLTVSPELVEGYVHD